jgi:hypothetical protein
VSQPYRGGVPRPEEVVTGVIQIAFDTPPAQQLEQMQHAINAKLAAGARVKHFRQTQLSSNYLVVTFVLEYPV